MPLFILSIIIQVAFVVHVVKTGRNTTWIWIIVMLPAAGALAYFVVEILPGFTNSRAGQEASRKVQSVVNPNKHINSAARNFSMSDSVENSMRLADECLKKDLYADAKELYVKCLEGPYCDDPHLLFGLAKANFGLGKFNEVKLGLDRLIELSPDYKNQNAHLLYARALEELDEIAAALHEYEALHEYFVGPDASFYYAKFLKSQNQTDHAQEILEQILTKANHLGKNYKSLHKAILKQTKAELSKA